MKVNSNRPIVPTFFSLFFKFFKIFSTKWLTNNAFYVNRFIKILEKRLNNSQILLISNGHLALEYALETIEKKGEIITTPFTFASTTHAILRKGFTPVFVDINEDDYNIDAYKIESLITDKTVGIMPVHVYGSPCDNELLEKISKKYNIKLLYDAAHAFNVKVYGQDISHFGDITMFSFHATKVFNTLEGGALIFKHKSDYEKVSKLINFGITGKNEIGYIGGNAKMDEIRAAIGIANLKKLKWAIRKRREASEEYIKHLKGIEGLIPLSRKSHVDYNYAYFPILLNDFKKTRDEIINALAEEEIEARKYFYPLTSDFKAYEGMFDSSKTPVAKRIADHILTLPLYPGLKKRHIKKICQIILEGN